VWLTREKTTAGWDGRVGAAAADQLYATAATEETPSGRPTQGGVAVRSRPSVLHLLTHSAGIAAAACRASRVASPRARVETGVFSQSSSSMF
jgi:hypothetical protein